VLVPGGTNLDPLSSRPSHLAPNPSPFHSTNLSQNRPKHDAFSFYTQRDQLFSPRRRCPIRRERLSSPADCQTLYRSLRRELLSSADRRKIRGAIHGQSGVRIRATFANTMFTIRSSGVCHSGGTNAYENFHATIEYRDRYGSTVLSTVYPSPIRRHRHHMYIANNAQELVSHAYAWFSSRPF
jgi:hypothetical protein